MYRIKPKGYSYQIGDTEIEQVFSEGYFEDVLEVSDEWVGMLGRYRHSGSRLTRTYDENYAKLQIDSRGRIYFPGYGPSGSSANRSPTIYCYDRGPNTSLLLFDKSNTEFSTLQVVVNTYMYTSNLSLSGHTSMDSFVIGTSTGNSAYTISGGNNFSEGVYFVSHAYMSGGSSAEHLANGDPPRAMGVVYPNSNGSFVVADSGQMALQIMDEDPASETKFWNDGTEGSNKFRGTGPSNIVLRPEKV